MFLEALYLAVGKFGGPEQVANECERVREALAQRGQRYRGDIPVGMCLDRRTDALKPVGKRGTVQASRAFEQQARCERGHAVLPVWLNRGSRLDKGKDGHERQLGHRCDKHLDTVIERPTLEVRKVVLARRCRRWLRRRGTRHGRRNVHGASAIARSSCTATSAGSRGTYSRLARFSDTKRVRTNVFTWSTVTARYPSACSLTREGSLK